MRTPEQVRWDFVQQWLDKARKDLKAAEVLQKSDLEDFDNVAFHCQQAVEKYIKALLVLYQIEIRKTDDIGVLRKQLARVEKSLSEALGPADVLTPHGAGLRYPSDVPPLSREEGAGLLHLADHVRQIVLAHLEPYLQRGRP